MNRKVTFFIDTNPEQKAEWRAIQQARSDLNKRESVLLSAAKSDPRIEIARRLGGWTDPEIVIEPASNGDNFLVSFIIAEKPINDGKTAPVTAPAKPQPARVYLDPKTLNLLLNGKMLTDEQKVTLLCRMDAGLEDVLRPAPAQEGVA